MIRSPRRAPGSPGSFGVSGVPLDSLYPRRVAVTWSQGRLSGDPATVAAALNRALALDRASLASAPSALSLLRDCFIPGTAEVSGDIPLALQ